ncbi:hypothetical protein [Clostridium cochlearium]|uniref:hypothetical protein n=1 Tax=Clostridium cochlearium TaxID=1494 RepID=UPI000BBC7B37|nr:hypothetical protein [Clostridium cochlearium]
MNIYVSYECKACKNEFILLTDQLVRQKEKGRYIVCPFCNSKRVNKENTADNLKECMKHRSYKRVNGALRQV